MRKFVIFTEGHGELIFVRHLLLQVYSYEHLSFRCFDLVSENLSEIPYKLDNPLASAYYLIINVGTDERVLSAITERYEHLVSQGFDIIGLRDMYSAEYKKKSATQIDQNANVYFHNSIRGYIQSLNNSERIRFFFAIMELEAWFLGLYEVLERLSPALTSSNIDNKLGIDLRVIDPETTFFHPAVNFKQILNLANIDYNKHTAEVEGIVSRISIDDFTGLAASNRCNSFSRFFREIQKEYTDSVS